MPAHQNSIVTRDYQGQVITYQDDGWFNATQAAAKWGKRPVDWLALQSTKDYIEALKRHQSDVRRTHITRKGNSKEFEQGTWLHPKLAVAFARWLDADFAVWCDSQIDGLIHGKSDWQNKRHAIASSSKVMSGMLEHVRAAIGKATDARHYMSEHKLINSLLTGEFKGLDRERLDTYQMDFLAHFELRDAIFIGLGMTYEQRKAALMSEAKHWGEKRLKPPGLIGMLPA